MSVGFKTTDFHNMDEKNWDIFQTGNNNGKILTILGELCLRHISTDVSFFKILQKSLVISYFSTEQRFVGNPDSDSRYVMGVIISHEVASYIKNFTLFLVTNMHYWCADVLIVIHSLTDSITCPYVTITRQFPASLVCVCVCDTQGLRIDVLSCVRREWVCERVYVCVWIKQLIPRPPERNILSARFSFPVSLWQGERKKKTCRGGTGDSLPQKQKIRQPCLRISMAFFLSLPLPLSFFAVLLLLSQI